MTAFAAFGREDVILDGGPISHVSHFEGVERWFCTACGSPLKASFAYLPDQVYVPLGVIDQATDIVPELHCHADAAMPWLKIDDDLDRVNDSGATILREAGND